MNRRVISKAWRIPDELGDRIEPLLPRVRRYRKGGRSVVPFRQVIDGIFYALRTECQWNAAPSEFGSGSTLIATSRSNLVPRECQSLPMPPAPRGDRIS